MPSFKDLTGQRNEGVIVVGHYGTKNGRHQWVFRCEYCGKEFISYGSDFTYGRIKSCGCQRRKAASERMTARNRVHGKRNTRLYTIWTGIKQRCGNPKAHAYEIYGGRGITVCQEWRDSFEAFYIWAMANGYADNLTIDRKDNDKGYTPDNCRWATMREQQNNRRNNRKEGSLETF